MAYAGDFPPGGYPKSGGHDHAKRAVMPQAGSGGGIPTAAVAVPPPGADSPGGGDSGGYRDAVWGVLFALTVLAEVIVAATLGMPALFASQERDVVTSTDGDGLSTSSLAAVMASCAAVAVLASVGFVYCITNCAESLVRVTVWSSILLNVVFAVVSVAFINSALAILWVILAVLSVMFWCSIRSHIPFATAHLRVASTAVRTHSGTIWWAFVSLIIGAVYAVVWAVASLGVASEMIKQRADPAQAGAMEGVAYVLQLLAFYWGINFVRFSLHVVVAGTVGTWWTTRDAKDPVYGAVRRAWTTSCGSVSLAALLIAIIQTIRQLVRQARDEALRRGGAAAACGLCFFGFILSCLESIARYITSYALVRVALVGESFITAGRATINMFRERGWDAVLNDIIIERTLLLAMLLFGAGAGITGAGLSWAFNPGLGADARNAATILAGVCGFVMGAACCSIVSMVIDSGVKTVFVAFGEQPDALRATHPELFQLLIDVWARFYPEELDSAGYAVRYGVPIERRPREDGEP